MTAPFRRVDAFLLGYLPHHVRAHFAALDLLDEVRPGSGGELAGRVETQLRALPLHGPEVVSAVWQVEDIFAKRVGAELPAPPSTGPDCAIWSQAIAAGADARWPDATAKDGLRASYDVGARVGAAEVAVDGAARLWSLYATSPLHVLLGERAVRARELLEQMAARPPARADTPTAAAEDASIAREVVAAVARLSQPPSDDAGGELEQIRDRLRVSARVLESVALGAPRASVRAWRDQAMNGGELMRRLAEHQRWIVPCRVENGRPAPRIFAFDKKVLFAFSDSEAMAARPTFLRDADQLFLTLPGTALFSWVPDDDIDVVVFDASDDPEAPLTINYPREMHARLHEVAGDVAVELAAGDWSQLELEPLRRHRFWILVGPGDMLKNLIDPDAHGRPRVGIFTTEAALDAHLGRATPEQLAAFAECQKLTLPGSALFPSLASLGLVGIVMNPSGPGRTRAFNKKTLEMLSAPASPA